MKKILLSMGKFIEVQLKNSTYTINTDYIVSVSLTHTCIQIVLRKQYSNIEITGEFEELKRKYIELKSKIFAADSDSRLGICEDSEY